ncbi:MAG TPA: FAD-dependent oxidoreductase [Nitrospiria bacterium]|nr:FAD-dependent oxidoreductase [Nitrospiria bacterium]
MSPSPSSHLIIVIGAGPAGLAAADQLSSAGHEVVIINRDCKFGGLAEYGIFPTKHRLRNGLRKNYREILNRPNVHYFGNVTVGEHGHLRLEELRALTPGAIIVASGAQGTKSLGLEGEKATGVFHAKDVVYHYNQLPGFSERVFHLGEHTAVIGIGDVMVDIAHWLIQFRHVPLVTAIARRGPAERKYNPKEIRAVCAQIDQSALTAEFARIGAALTAVGQQPDAIRAELLGELKECNTTSSTSILRFHFLASPRRVLVDDRNYVRGLELEEMVLALRNGDVAAVGTGRRYEFPCDSVIFAVGDCVDGSLGLPSKNGAFLTNPNHTDLQPDDALFQAYDPSSGRVIDGVFVTGWARQASVGLVGIAKRDGDWCAQVVQRHLAGKSAAPADPPQAAADKLRRLIASRQPALIDRRALTLLSLAEEEGGTRLGSAEFKFSTNEEMIAAIQQQQA